MLMSRLRRWVMLMRRTHNFVGDEIVRMNKFLLGFKFTSLDHKKME